MRLLLGHLILRRRFRIAPLAVGGRLHLYVRLDLGKAPSDIGRCVTYCGDDLGRCDFSEAKAPKEGLPVMVVSDRARESLTPVQTPFGTPPQFLQYSTFLPYGGVAHLAADLGARDVVATWCPFRHAQSTAGRGRVTLWRWPRSRR